MLFRSVRKYIFESPVLEDKERMIGDAVDAFLAGFEQVFGAELRVRRVPVKAVG